MKIKLSDTSGFTLIEAIISLGVLSIGILALFAMQTLSIRGNSNANLVSSLATKGSDVIEDKILVDKYSNIKTTVPNPNPCQFVGNEIKYIEKNRTVLNDKPVKDVKTVDVILVKCLNGSTDGKELTLRYLKGGKESL